MDAEQDNTDYCSRVWQLHKLQKLKLRDSQQSTTQKCILLSNKQNQTRTTANEKWSIKVMDVWGSVCKCLSHRRDIV